MEQRDDTSATHERLQGATQPGRDGKGGITYEGIDCRHLDPYLRLRHFLPGDRVRLDLSALPNDTDGREMRDRLGEAALTVGRTVVTGIRESRPHGPLNRYEVEHEFEDVEGRFTASAFQPELGRIQTYGLLAERGGRLWLAPLHQRHELAGDIHAGGPAREVIGFADRQYRLIQQRGFDAFKADVASAPVSGEIHYQMAVAYEDRTGPVTLLDKPWTRPPTNDEMKAGMHMIDMAIGKEGYPTEMTEATKNQVSVRDGHATGAIVFDGRDAASIEAGSMVPSTNHPDRLSEAELAVAILVHAVIANDGLDADHSRITISKVERETCIDVGVPKGRGFAMHTLIGHTNVERAFDQAGPGRRLKIDFADETIRSQMASVSVDQALGTLGMDWATIGLARKREGVAPGGPQKGSNVASSIQGAAAGHAMRSAQGRGRD